MALQPFRTYSPFATSQDFENPRPRTGQSVTQSSLPRARGWYLQFESRHLEGMSDRSGARFCGSSRGSPSVPHLGEQPVRARRQKVVTHCLREYHTRNITCRRTIGKVIWHPTGVAKQLPESHLLTDLSQSDNVLREASVLTVPVELCSFGVPVRSRDD